MAYEQKETDIAIFKEKERKSDKAPHWRGTAVVNGVTLEVALWEKGTSGTMLAGAIKPKDDSFRGGGGSGVRSGGSESVAGSRREPAFDGSDDIPFATSDSIW